MLENVLWNWSILGRPYLVHKEGSKAICGGDPVPVWFHEWCVYRELCQCNLIGKNQRGDVRFLQHQGWLSSWRAPR